MADFILQSNFQYGEITELLHAQVESGIYYKAARRLRNVLVLPQGGVQKRFGTIYTDTISATTDPAEVRIITIEMRGEDKYLLVFTNNQLEIYYNNAIVATKVTTFEDFQLVDIDYAVSNNMVVITQSEHLPATLVQTSVHTGWEWNESPNFVHFPTYEFDKNYDAFSFTIRDRGLTNFITTGDNKLGAQVDLWSSSAIFTTNHEGALFFGDGGILRLETRVVGNETTRINARIIQLFDDDSYLFVTTGANANQILGADAVLTQIAFNSVTGFPTKVTFYQNRLFFANTFALPNGLWGSNYNGYGYDTSTNNTQFLFNDAFTLDTSAISTLLSSNGNLTIESLLSFVSLVIATNVGIYSTTLQAFDPITPSTVAFINRQSGESTAQNVHPVILDTNVLFAPRGGRKINSATITNNETSYDVTNVSILAPQLIGSPTDLAVYENGVAQDGRWLIGVNSEDDLDGTLAIYQNVPEQQINAWTLSSTDGFFRQVSAVDDFVYFLVERTIDGNTELQIEYLSFDVYSDSTSQYSGAATDTITGLSHLEGKTVKVVGDGAVMEDAVVSSGSITLSREVETADVGLAFESLIRPMPLNVPLQMGPDIYKPKSIKSVYVDFYQSTAIYVNGTILRPFRMDVDQYDTPPTLKTSYAQIEPFGGWDPRQNIDITSSDPVPMTIIGVGYVVDA